VAILGCANLVAVWTIHVFVVDAVEGAQPVRTQLGTHEFGRPFGRPLMADFWEFQVSGRWAGPYTIHTGTLSEADVLLEPEVFRVCACVPVLLGNRTSIYPYP
jgi:hypothetical protein